MIMIDTLMAFWNQDRRKRAMQVLLTFFLLCISISVLFVLLRPAQSQHPEQKATVSTATVPSFGNTVVPNLTPTMSVVIGTQPTPVPTTQPTPAPTAQTPCSTTPSGATSNGLSANINIEQGQAPTTTATATTTPTSTGTPYVPKNHNDGGGGGGGLMPGVTPTFSVPGTPPTQNTPPGTQPGGGSWGSNCTTSNSILNGTSQNVLATIIANIWVILGASLLCTILFYGSIFVAKRHAL